ncbi:hypothetical protein [Spiroplasma floricola]|uniref:LD-carboxypeptidase C-terminal domain-containing protein n=1 Tax=Spiroplasma floricola 23-6 TaxID=1336749 RepID=A0A2K8SFD2_9MOLU|nr:hypothetical protein [Spiroplasma floricola]AUB31540.1 hypothetical protein SFLOR_v1c04880 [Spiroplasma floricola 23-6]
MKIAAFNIIDSVEKNDIGYFENSVEFFKNKGFKVIVPENKMTDNKQEWIEKDFERIINRKPFIALPTFCKANEVNFIKKANWKKIKKSKVIFCGNSFITPFLNAISKFTSNEVLYGPNFISNFNLESKDDTYVSLIKKISIKHDIEEIQLNNPKFFGKKIVKGNLIGGEITSFLEMYKSGYISKVTKKDILLIDGIFKDKEDIKKIIFILKRYKILNKVKGILVCQSVIDNQEMLKIFLSEMQKIKKTNIAIGLKGMMSDEINILKLNKEIIINFKEFKILQ